MKKIVFFFVVVLFSSSSFCATGTINSDYKYDYTQPPEFQPSMNSQFSSLAGGVTDVYANPAGIMKVSTLEVAFGVSSYVRNPIYSDDNTIYMDDTNMGGVENSPNSRSYVRLTDDRNSITPEARPIAISEDYSKGGGINYFGMTYKISDWLAFSISRKRPTAVSFAWQTLMPVMLDAQSNFRGTSVEANGTGIRFRDDGTVEVYYQGITVATSDVSAWEGFLTQGTSEVNWLNASFDNKIMNQNSICISTAMKTGQVSWGLNIMPESIDMELNNDAYLYSDSSNQNMSVSLPNFGSTTEEVINWATFECSSSAGYHTVSIESLPGQQLASAKVAGKYSASFVQMDLGVQWEPFDFLTLGAVYKNFNGASIKLEGVNVTQYVQHRLDSTSKMPTEEGASYWNPYLDTPTHEVETEQSIRNILTFPTIELPKKIIFGAALKKPMLLALDYEMWQNEYKYSSDPSHPELAHYINIYDIKMLRLGMETQIFFLPAIMRGSLTGMLKPSSDDIDLQKSIDDAYSTLPIMPVDGNIYLGFGVYDGELGLGVGGGGLPLLKTLMYDVSGLVKVFYTNVYFKRGDWQVSYLMTMDPILTGFASDLSTTGGTETQVRLMQTSTLSLGYKF